MISAPSCPILSQSMNSSCQSKVAFISAKNQGSSQTNRLILGENVELWPITDLKYKYYTILSYNNLQAFIMLIMFTSTLILTPILTQLTCFFQFKLKLTYLENVENPNLLTYTHLDPIIKVVHTLLLYNICSSVVIDQHQRRPKGLWYKKKGGVGDITFGVLKEISVCLCFTF